MNQFAEDVGGSWKVCFAFHKFVALELAFAQGAAESRCTLLLL
jgi:hypothetical protein